MEAIMFGADFFKVMRFVFALVKLLAQIFGNDEDRQAAEDNGFAPTKE